MPSYRDVYSSNDGHAWTQQCAGGRTSIGTHACPWDKRFSFGAIAIPNDPLNPAAGKPVVYLQLIIARWGGR
jgi:hypothetical protein